MAARLKVAVRSVAHVVALVIHKHWVDRKTVVVIVLTWATNSEVRVFVRLAQGLPAMAFVGRGGLSGAHGFRDTYQALLFVLFSVHNLNHLIEQDRVLVVDLALPFFFNAIHAVLRGRWLGSLALRSASLVL